jgi:putative ABC transport system permease protein
MARSSLERRAGRSLPYIALAGVVTMAFSVVLLLVSGRDLVAGLTAVFLLILGFASCVPLAVRWASKALSPAAQSAGGTTMRMAVSGIGASLSRTAIAIVALAIAISATIGVSIMVDSFRGSVQDWLEQTLQADVYAGVQRGAMRPDLIADLRNIEGVTAVSTSRRTWVEDASGRTQLLAIRMVPGAYAGTELLDGTPDDVWAAWESDDVVLVSEPYAYQHRVTAGDFIALPTGEGERRFRVAARYQSYDINASAVMISRANYDRYFDDDGVDTLGLYLSSGTDVDGVIANIKAISEGRQRLRVDSNARIRDLSLEIFDQTFVITDVLYWLATGVAFIGILAAMLALQLERAREFGMLRALGMTPRQVGSMVTVQTSVIGFLSGIAAIPLGVVMAWVLIKVINRRAFGWQIDMAIEPRILLSAVVFAVGVSLLAGIYPAWRAGRNRPAIVMREE